MKTKEKINTDVLKKALKEVNQARRLKLKISTKIWRLVRLSIEKYGLDKVAATLGMSPRFIQSKLMEIEKSIICEKDSTKADSFVSKEQINTQTVDGFAVMDLMPKREPDQDFKMKIKVGDLTLELVGNSNTFQWGKLFESLQGGLRC